MMASNDNTGSWTLSVSSQAKEPIAASAPSQIVAVTGSVAFGITVEWFKNGFTSDVTLSVPCSTGIDLSFPKGNNCVGSGKAEFTLHRPAGPQHHKNKQPS